MTRELTHAGRKLRRYTEEQKAKWVEKFRQSGMSARSFATRHRLPYPGLLVWNRNAGEGEVPAVTEFVEVELPAEPSGLMVEIGEKVRMSVHNADQARLAGQLLGTLTREAGC